MSSLKRFKRQASARVEGMEDDALESFVVPNSKITVLINELGKMSKNPSIDSSLSEVLDEFLEKLEENEKYLEQGIHNINFAQAALLLQSSADLYSKKVDLLWDCIFEYQKRMLLADDQCSEKEQEIEKLEERKRKHKRKRKVNADDTQVTNLVNQFSWGGNENIDYLNQNYEAIDLAQEWQKFGTYTTNEDNLKLQYSSQNLFLPNDPVHSEDSEYIGRYDQFHSASIISEIFHLEDQQLLPDEQACVTRMRIDSHVINDFLHEKAIPSDKPRDCYLKELGQYINDFIESRRMPLTEQPCTSEILPPVKLIPDQPRRCSAADSLFDDDRFSSISGHCSSPGILRENSFQKGCDNDLAPIIEENQTTGTITEKRNKSCSQDSAFFEVSIGELDDNIEDNVELAVVSEKLIADSAEAGTVTTNITATDKENNNVTVTTSPKRTKLANAITNNQLCCGSTVIVTRKKERKRWTSLLEGELDETKDETSKRRKIEPKKRQISEKMLAKLSTGVTANFRDFESFFRQQYQPSEDEGVIPPCLTDSDSSDSDGEDDALSDTDEPLNIFEPEIEEEEPIEDPDINELEPTQEPETNNIEDVQISDLVHPVSLAIRGLNLSANDHTSPPELGPSTSAFCNSSLQASRKNVREWRSFILPKLKNMESKSDFDIHEYGSRILDSREVGQSQHFKDIVKGKGASEVARYFIATLQLANTNNVEIGGVTPGESANDSFILTTRDKTRHHELLEEYQAPSEESFMERLGRVALHSTPFGASPPKKRKIGCTSRKKLF